MTTELVVALVASGAALIGSALSVYATLSSNRSTQRLQLEVERMRLIETATRDRYLVLDRELSQISNLEGELVAKIQILKDVWLLILTNPPEAFRAETLLEALRKPQTMSHSAMHKPIHF